MGQAWRRSRSAARHGATTLLLYAFSSRRATLSLAPGLGVFRVLDGFGRMFDRHVLGVSFCNGVSTHRRLATFARAIRLGAFCIKVTRLVTGVANVCPIGLRDGGPRGRRGANRCERLFLRRPLVLCRESDFDRRWAGHFELQVQLVCAVPVQLGGCNRL